MSTATLSDLRDLIGKYFYGFAESFDKDVIESRGVIEILLPIHKSKGHRVANICIYANTEELDNYADTIGADSGSAIFGLEMLSRHRTRRCVLGPDIIIGMGGGEVVKVTSGEAGSLGGHVPSGINYVLKSIDIAIQSGKTYITLVFGSNSKHSCDLHFYGVFFRLEKIEK